MVGQATGAQLVKPGTNLPVALEDLIGADSSILQPDLATMDPVTGLIRPQAGISMLLADGTVSVIPDDWFIHPHTGRVLPIEGHVSYDPISSRLIFTADSSSGKNVAALV